MAEEAAATMLLIIIISATALDNTAHIPTSLVQPKAQNFSEKLLLLLCRTRHSAVEAVNIQTGQSHFSRPKMASRAASSWMSWASLAHWLRRNSALGPLEFCTGV